MIQISCMEWVKPRPAHPHLQQNYTEHETTPCWNIEFWSFLSKTKRVWPFAGHVHCEFFLCALHLGLWNFLPFFWWGLGPLCDHTFGAGLNLACPSFWGLNSDDFPFFYFLSRPNRTRVSPFWIITRNWQHLRNSSQGGVGSQWFLTDFSLISNWFLKCCKFLVIFQKGLTQVLVGLEKKLKKGKSSEINPRNDGHIKFSPSPKVWSQKGPNLHQKNGKKFHNAKWSARRKNSQWTWPANSQTRLVLLRNDQNSIFQQGVVSCPV